MSEIEERLNRIYGDSETSKEAFVEVEKVLKHYKNKISSTGYKISHEDIVLITYADQIVEPSEVSIKTMKKFLDRNLEGLINSVHILPFYPYSSDDGFSVANYYEVAPNFGSWRDVNSLGKDYRLMFDGVINHISSHSKWFEYFLNGDDEYRDYFIEEDPKTDLSRIVRPRTTPLLSEFRDNHGELHYLWTTFSRDQIDLNYKNPKVLAKMIDILLFYIHHGAKLLRLDAIAFLWKDVETESIHLPQTHEIIKLIRTVIDMVAPDVVLITETNVPHNENISYFGDGNDEAHMVYNFALPPLLAFSIIKEDGKKLTDWGKSIQLPSDKTCFFNFNASHDGVGVRAVSSILSGREVNGMIREAKRHGGLVSYRTVDGEEIPYEINCSYMNLLTDPKKNDTLQVKKMILAQAVTLAMPGVPAIYFQSLVGGSNYHHGFTKTGNRRTVNREKYFLETLEKELHKEGLLRNRIFYSMKKLLSIRKSEKAFDPHGSFEFLELDSRLFSIVRHSLDRRETVLALHNLSSTAVEIELPKEFRTGFELFSNSDVSRVLTIKKFEVAWVKKRR
jgi:glycosidase